MKAGTATELQPFFLDRQALVELGRANAERYRSAQPFPHVVLDDFVPGDVVERVVAEFPSREDAWDLYVDDGNSLKLATSDESRMGPATRQLIAEFNGGAMIEFLEVLTGISGLVPDPHLVGGGLHQLGSGGFLRVHADFNRHERLNLDRRINLLLYLNPGWKEEYGGNLELWSRDMSSCVRQIAPEAGRCVIFNTTDFSFHGNPQPVSAPDEQPRRSLAFYYYSNGRPEEERSEIHSTLYQTPGVAPARATPPPARWKGLARRLVPPVLLDLVKRLRARRR